jgi:hypothetical protein
MLMLFYKYHDLNCAAMAIAWNRNKYPTVVPKGGCFQIAKAAGRAMKNKVLYIINNPAALASSFQERYHYNAFPKNCFDIFEGRPKLIP